MSESEGDAAHTESDLSDRDLDPIHTRGNQFIRKTVVALNRGANDLINHSSVAKYTLSSVGRFVEPVVKLADPIVSSIDDRIDSIVDAIRHVTVIEHPLRSNTRACWDSLKRTFVSSAWYRNVESILSASAAEYFYVTALSCYFDLDPTASCEEFLIAIRLRMSDTWDERLTQPARVFYATARTATAVIGLGTFVRGAIGLGRSKIHSAMGQIAETWDRVVGVTDNVVDRWRPEFSRRPSSHGPVSGEDTAESGTGGDGPVASILIDDVKLIHGDSIINGKRRGMSVTTPKTSRRVRQRLLLPVGLREKLSEDLWFDRIDMILDKNIVIRSLSSMSQPAGHFFDTACRVYLGVSDIEEFVESLRNTLGPAWDADLERPSQRFYEIASSL